MPPRKTIEAKWKFLGGLDYGNVRQIRRVMAMIQHRTGRKQRIDRRWSWKRLHREERKIVTKMLSETKGNYLLFDMLVWFAGHLNGSSTKVYNAMAFLREKATHFVRNRRLYYEEYKNAKKEWQAFRGGTWQRRRDRDEETEDEELGGVSLNGEHPRKTLAQKQQRLATFEVDYVKQHNPDEDEYLTEDDEMSSDEMDDESSEDNTPPLKVWNDNPSLQALLTLF